MHARVCKLESCHGKLRYVHEVHNGGMVDAHRVLLRNGRSIFEAWGQPARGNCSRDFPMRLVWGLVVVLIAAILLERIKRGEWTIEMLSQLRWWTAPRLDILLVAMATLVAVLSKGGITEERVVVISATGIQLETVYSRGRVERRLVPLESVKSAFINEAVGVHSCHFYLALLLRDSCRLTLVFRKLQPPLALLVPILNSILGAMEKQKHLKKTLHGKTVDVWRLRKID